MSNDNSPLFIIVAWLFLGLLLTKGLPLLAVLVRH